MRFPGRTIAIIFALTGITSIASADGVAIVCVERSNYAQNTEKISFDFERRIVMSHFGWLGDRGHNLPLQVRGSIISWVDSKDFINAVDMDTGEMQRLLYGAVVATLDCRVARKLL
jgi:hypothetical protein